MKNPNPFKQFITPGVRANFEKSNRLGDLWAAVVMEYRRQPDRCSDGGNDKKFFSMIFCEVKLFVVQNEINGLTIMLPEEY